MSTGLLIPMCIIEPVRSMCRKVCLFELTYTDGILFYKMISIASLGYFLIGVLRDCL